MIDDIKLILQIAEEKSRADGCKGCAFESVEEWEEPCRRCSRNCRDYWRSNASHYAHLMPEYDDD